MRLVRFSACMVLMFIDSLYLKPVTGMMRHDIVPAQNPKGSSE